MGATNSQAYYDQQEKLQREAIAKLTPEELEERHNRYLKQQERERITQQIFMDRLNEARLQKQKGAGIKRRPECKQPKERIGKRLKWKRGWEIQNKCALPCDLLVDPTRSKRCFNEYINLFRRNPIRKLDFAPYIDAVYKKKNPHLAGVFIKSKNTNKKPAIEIPETRIARNNLGVYILPKKLSESESNALYEEHMQKGAGIKTRPNCNQPKMRLGKILKRDGYVNENKCVLPCDLLVDPTRSKRCKKEKMTISKTRLIEHPLIGVDIAKPKPEPEPEPKTDIIKTDIIKECLEPINAIYSYLNSTSKHNLKKIGIEKFKELLQAVRAFSFYPTPQKYSEKIYNDVIKEGNDAKIIDIGSGLGSLSLPFIKTGDFKNLVMIERNETFYNYLKCFERANNKIQVVQSDIFDIQSEAYDIADVIIMNPPFEKTLYLKFILKAIDILLVSNHKKNEMNKGSYIESLLYVICPSTGINAKNNEISFSKKLLSDTLKDKNFSSIIKEAIKDYNNGENRLFQQIDDLGKVEGFRGLNKRGEPVNIGMTANLYKIIVV
jgi:predicted RNA methylase